MAPRPLALLLQSAGRPPWRLIAALGLYVLVSVAVFGGIAAYFTSERHDAGKTREAELLHELERRETARHALESTLLELRRQLDQRERAHAALQRSFRRLDAERAALEAERNLARQRAELLDQGSRETERWLETAQRERQLIERERTALEARLVEIDAARAAAEHRARSLHGRLESTTRHLARLEADRDATTRWLASWIRSRLGAIETVLQQTGIGAERLLAGTTDAPERAPETGPETGIGGPLLALAEPAAGDAPPFRFPTPLVQDLAGDIDRLEAAERLLAAVPLAAPFDHYHQTSRFGPRTDPITRRRALHNGLDFGAAAGSEVLATAPGRVTRAGRMGSYGIMVEIDHGHGITTRYAHLSRSLVEPGDRVGLRTPVGIIGNTGRSTGRHLHYEVRLDDTPKDPARFIAAGRQLIRALGS